MGTVQSCIERIGSAREKYLLHDDALRPTRTCLPQVDPFVEERKEELKRVNRQYELDLHKGDLLRSGLPAGIKRIPKAEKQQHKRDFGKLVQECITEYMGDLGEDIANGSRGRWKSFQEIEDVLFTPSAPAFVGTPNTNSSQSRRAFPRPTTMYTWEEDIEFARQRLTGAHPVVLNQVLKCELLPKKLLVTDEQVVGLIEEESVEEAVAARKLFIIDYHKLLDDIPTRKDTYMCSPMGLFYSNSKGLLRPIAIQLYGGPTAQDLNPVFTPNDNVWAWRMAKMYFNSADMHYHLISSLVCRCILTVALCSIITCRCLSIHHPIRQLLSPFLQGSIGASEAVLQSLVSKGSPLMRVLACGFDGWFKIASKSWAKYNFNNQSFMHDYTERIDKGSPLRGYYYRDDSMHLWKALHGYVKGIATRFYKKPDDIDLDTELQKWTREMVNHLNRFMELQTSRKEQPIVFNVTSILFLCTGFASSLTFNIYQQYGWVPNSPGLISIPPIVHKTKDQITENDLLAMLPDKKTTILQVATAFVLSGLYDSDQAPHKNPLAFPKHSPCYVDNLGTGFSLKSPNLPTTGEHGCGEQEAEQHDDDLPTEGVGKNKLAFNNDETTILDIYGIQGDHRQYTSIRGTDMTSDAGDVLIESIIVYQKPIEGKDLTHFQIKKSESKIGNWVSPAGKFPESGPAADHLLTLEGEFWAQEVDVENVSSGAVYIRVRSGTALLPASTSVGKSKYSDGYWDIITSFLPAGQDDISITETNDTGIVSPLWKCTDDMSPDDIVAHRTQRWKVGSPTPTQSSTVFQDRSVAPTLDIFVEGLCSASRKIAKRNDGLKIPYEAVDPSYMERGISQI